MKNHPIPVYPEKDKNIAGMKVPKGGSHCLNCRFLKDKAEKICGEPNFVKWNFGSSTIPGELDAFCSIWYEPRKSLADVAR